MALLSVANLEISFGTDRILDGASLTLEPGDHVGLVGRNGTGKSTLLKLIAGLGGVRHDAGQVQIARGATVGYLHQDHKLDPARTLRDEAAAAFEHLRALHHQLDKLSHDMAEAHGEALDRILAQYEKLEHQIAAAGGYNIDHQIDATLHGLGLTDEMFELKVADLSGGQRGRLALAKLLLSNPDILLLDEPTNHLDIAGREWLEAFLQTYPGAVIVISHDRWLLDRVVSRIYELEYGRLTEYPGNYYKFRELRAERQLTIQRSFEKQQTKIKQEQAFIDRYRAGQRAKQAQGREKRLERFKRDQAMDRPIEMSVMNLQLPEPARCNEIVVSAEHLTKGYEGKPLFDDFDLTIKRGDRIGIIGPNGAGKSTLVNCLLGSLEPDRGRVRVGTGVDIGYFRQGQEHLDPDLTVVEYLKKAVTLTEQEARNLAGAFLFTGIDQDKPMGVLSGGERVRAVLASLVAGRHNVLVFDEPTNHLDIPSSERLEDTIKRFCKVGERRREKAGTLLLITHDRMLLEDTVDQLIILDGSGGIRLFMGTYSELLAQQRAEAAARAQGTAATNQPMPRNDAQSEKKAAATTATPNKPTASQEPKPRKGNADKGRGKSKLHWISDDKLEQQIETLTTRLKQLDDELADPDTYRDHQRFAKLQDEHNRLSRELKPLEDEWLRRAEENT